MKLIKLHLENYRCFSSIDVTLHPKLTVFIAENGQGKSTLLDAMRIALWPYVSSFDLSRNAFNDSGNAIAVDDVRLLKLDSGDMTRQLPVFVEMTGDFGSGQENTWVRYRDKETKLTKTKDGGATGFMRQWATVIQEQIRNPAKPTLNLPVFGYYGTGRLWAQKRLTEATKGKDDTQKTDFYVRTFAYLNCLDPASSYKHFKEWFIWAFESYRELQIKQLEGSLAQGDITSAHERIQVVQQAIDIFLKPTTGWHTLEYSVSHEKSLVLQHVQYGVLKVDSLSDGIRSVLAMVGDIAYRCIKLNPHLGAKAALETQGVVLIDEVDMHLHPSWQQTVLGQLQQAFPCVQFIVTTHSPQVLSTVKRENIRVIGLNREGRTIAEPPLAMTYGEPSGLVMHSVMQVDPQPPVQEKQDLQRLTELVDQGNYTSEEAQQLTQKLNAGLGAQHPQLQRLQRSIQRQKAMKA